MRARTWGTPSTAWVAISCRHTHRRRSSGGRLHSWPNSSRLAVTMGSSSVAGRGMGRSYGPNERRARCPTIEPGGHAQHGRTDHLHERAHPGHGIGRAGQVVVAAGRGAVLVQRAGQLLEQRAVGVEGLLGPHGAGDGHHASRPRPVIEVDSPVALATCRSATRASCSILMRSSGSMLGSGCSPMAIDRASWRAASQLIGPCCWNIRARSPNSGIPLKGLSSPKGSGPAGRRSRSRLHGRRATVRLPPRRADRPAATVAGVRFAGRPGIMAAWSTRLGAGRSSSSERPVRSVAGSPPWPAWTRPSTASGALDVVPCSAPGATRGRPATVEVHALAPTDPGVSGVALGSADAVVHLGDPRRRARARRAAAARSDSPAQELSRRPPRCGGPPGGPVGAPWSTGPGPPTPCRSPRRRRCAPTPRYGYAAGRAEVERLVAEWRLDQPAGDGRGAAPDRDRGRRVGGLAGAVARGRRGPCGSSGADRPSQFLHLDDLASAVDHARRQRLDGPFNVSPDGWLSRDALAELAGPVGRVHLPASWVAGRRDLRGRLGVRGTGRPARPTPSTRGWWPTTGCGRPAGSRASQRRGLRRGRSGWSAGRDEPAPPPGAVARRRRVRRRRPPGRRGLGDPPSPLARCEVAPGGRLADQGPGWRGRAEPLEARRGWRSRPEGGLPTGGQGGGAGRSRSVGETRMAKPPGGRLADRGPGWRSRAEPLGG